MHEYIHQNRLKCIKSGRHGPFDRTQGAKVKKAIHALKMINNILTINNFDEQTQQDFYKTYLVKNAPCKDGANHISSPTIIANLAENWNKYSLEDKKFRCRALIQNVGNTRGLSFAQKVADQFSHLFDFSFENHKSTHPDKLSDILYSVVSKHIVVMFHAFPGLKNLGDLTKNDIIDKFLMQSVVHQQQWSRLLVRGSKGREALT
jgi:hypothetical protein